MENRSLYGYDLDDIDGIAANLFQVIAEEQIPTTLAILALCRAITMLGTEEDMDLACVMIDQIRDMTKEDEEYVEEAEVEDEY